MSPHAALPSDLERAYAKISLRILPILMLGYVVAYLDRVNVGFAKLQMLDALGFSETVYGLGAGIFFIGYFLFEVPSNMMLRRIGARAWIARIMITWGLLSAATMLVTSPTGFYVVRFLLGAAEAGFFPGVIFYLSEWYPSKRRGKVTAIFMSSIALCSAFGSLISGLIMQGLDNVRGWGGWQWLFLIEGLAAVLVGLVVLACLHDSVSGAPWLGSRDKALVEADLARDAASKPMGSFGDAFRSPRIWFASLVYFCLITGLYGLGFWLPTIVSDLGVRTPLAIGLVSALPYAVAAAGMIWVGRRADRKAERRWHTALPAIIGAAGLVASVAFAASPSVAIVGLTLAAFGILATLPMFWTLPVLHARGATAAAGIAIINSCGNLAGFASPYAVGWIKDATGSTAIGILGVAGFVLTGAVLILVGTRTEPSGTSP